MGKLHESIRRIAERSGDRAKWWAEPSARNEGHFVVRSPDGVVADGLTQAQAMHIAAEYNLARTDAATLADRLKKK